jgi:hypothetical protein
MSEQIAVQAMTALGWLLLGLLPWLCRCGGER